jgi:hypothetical protein
VVTDPAVWERVLADIAPAAGDAGLRAARAIRSPLTGSDGNVEFLVDLRGQESGDAEMAAYEESVSTAVRGLGGENAGPAPDRA